MGRESKENILLSICIPTRNQPHALRQTLNSILPQIKTSDVEVIICDDSDESESKAIVDSYHHDAIRYFYGEKKGFDAAILFLTEETRGRYLLWFGDDLMEDGMIAKIKELVETYPDISFIWINSRDQSNPDAAAFKIRADKFFNNKNEIIETDIGLLAFASSTVIKKENILDILPSASKYKGSSLMSLFLVLGAISSGGQYYFIGHPYILCNPKPAGEVRWYDSFQVHGLNYFIIAQAFKDKFDRRALRKGMADQFGRIWRAVIVERAMGYTTGFGSKSPKLKKMLRLYWNFPEFWLALPFLIIPRSILRIIYKIYKFFKQRIIHTIKTIIRCIVMSPQIAWMWLNGIKIRNFHEYELYTSFFRHFPFASINKENIVTFFFEGKKVKMACGEEHPVFLSEVFGMKVYDKFADFKGKDVVDVGTAFGDSTIYFGLKGAKRVYGYEINERHFNLCLKNIELNGLQEICKIELCGIGKENNLLDVSNPTLKTTVQKKDMPLLDGIKTKTLNEIVKEHNIVDGLLKIDVDGFEYDILEGATHDTLQHFTDIVMEYHYGVKNLPEKLKECGFATHIAKPYKIFIEYYPKGFQQMEIGYILAVRDSKISSIQTSNPSLIVCPYCKKNLNWKHNYAVCQECNKKYPIEKEIIRFLSVEDKFYENCYARQIHYLPGKNPLKDWGFFNLVQSGVLGEIKRVIKPDAKVLDVGCAGGIKWLGSYAQTIGLDISFASLVKAKEIYSGAVQVGVENLPFKNSSFDLIYGSYIFEHLSPEIKEKFLKEAFRVLKPNGKLILQFDTLSNNWLTRFTLKNPKAYKRGFIDVDSHIWLEPLSKTIKHLKNTGFGMTRINKFGTTVLQYEPTYNWLNVSYGETVPWVRFLGKITHKITTNQYSGVIMEFLVTLFDKLMNPFSKIDSATRAILVAKKNSNSQKIE